MSETNNKQLPGVEIINGVAYLNTTSGDLRRADQLPAKEALIHEQVYRMIEFAKGLAAEISRFKAHTFADVEALDAMLAQEYGVTRKGGKGNRSFTSADGKFRVSIKINTPEVVGPELQQAKALIDEIVLEKGADADPVLAALVAQAFDVGKQGRVNTDMLRRLKKLEIDDPRWPSIQKAIGDAITDGVSKAYITFHQWREGGAGGWSMIPLDMAAVHITEDAFDHPSLRRQVADAEVKLREMWSDIPDHLGLVEALTWLGDTFDMIAAEAERTADVPYEIEQGMMAEEIRASAASTIAHAAKLLEHLKVEGAGEPEDAEAIEHLNIASEILAPVLQADAGPVAKVGG